MADFQFLGGEYRGRSPSFDAERTVNLFPVLAESNGARSAVALYGTPGLKLWTTLTGGGVRGCIRFTETQAIIVCGTTVWSVNASGTATALTGSVANTTAVVSMASNGSVIMCVTGGTDGYFINPTAMTVTTITAAAFAGGGRVDFIDGYFVWNHINTGQFQITQLYGTAINALDFATAEGAPDPLVSVIVDHREVWLLGSTSTEVWYDAGGTDFPLQRIQGAFLEIGCAATNSVAKLDNSIFWLATDDRGYGTIQRAAGYTPARVSNNAVEVAIAAYTVISDAVAYTYAQEGASFYVITFPTAGATWCLDVANGLWHERPYRKTDGTLTRHRSNCQMNFAGKTLVGDWESGNVYQLDLETFTDNGDAILALRACRHVTNDGKYLFNASLELFMQTGVGDNTTPNPQARLRWSDDGGYSWSNEHFSTIGAIGDRKTRVKWRRLGVSRDRVYEVAITDPVRRVFTGASLMGSGGL